MNYDSRKGDCPRCGATLPKAKGTGHGSEPLEPLRAAMLLRTVRMRSVHIDPATRTTRAEAGTLWQNVTVPAGQHGLAALAGTSPNVGVTGYSLGGGLGWLARRYGLGRQQRHGGRTRDPGRPARPGRRRPGPPGGESQKIDFQRLVPRR